MKWIYLLCSTACFFVSFTKNGDEGFHWLILGFVMMAISKLENLAEKQ